MENVSGALLQLEGLSLPHSSVLPVFCCILLSYVLMMLMNLGNSVLILKERSLHQPMYLLLCNLCINDIIGGTHVIPQFLSDLLRAPEERLISYGACVTQAFVSHVFATASHTILMIMAVLIGLSVRLSRCRSVVTNPYCDNASLFKLSCESTLINNVYGLLFTALLLSASIGSTLLTYLRITLVCLRRHSSSLNRRALQTCSTHLLVYLLLLLSGVVVITLHRFPEYTHHRKMTAVILFTGPGTVNPIIYGVQCRDIRCAWARHWARLWVPVFRGK
ncbi:olfactory receptor 4E1-like [Periophthalmus magnuspinnatus]|uniref:olfactory receptor 4E1-like n=1 Tax=Periophthalmus magnuspinnatus TaxID=409849 RepID=UPI0024367EF3|nr:olfactory receptor 4E1-like [Periophthalmus magnuspinnatus]